MKVRITKLPKAQTGGQTGPGFDNLKVPYNWDNNGQGKLSPTWEGEDLSRFTRKYVDPNQEALKAKLNSNYTPLPANTLRNDWEMKQFQPDELRQQMTNIDYMHYNTPDNNIYRDKNAHYSTTPVHVQTPNDLPGYAKFGGLTQKGYALDRNDGYIDSFTGDGQQPSVKNVLGSSPRKDSVLEAEKGESLLGDMNGDGQLEFMSIGGKKHYDGGTPLNVPQGAFIFSDTPKMRIGGEILSHFGKPEDTKKKYTPAELSKQYDLTKYQDKAKNEPADKFAQDTAALMIDNNQKQLAKLAFVQEAMKGNPMPQVSQQIMQQDQQNTQGQPQARYGGMAGFPSFQIGGQHLQTDGTYGIADSMKNQFNTNQAWYVKDHPNFNMGNRADVLDFQNAYTKATGSNWFTGKGTHTTDGKGGETTASAPAFERPTSTSATPSGQYTFNPLNTPGQEFNPAIMSGLPALSNNVATGIASTGAAVTGNADKSTATSPITFNNTPAKSVAPNTFDMMDLMQSMRGIDHIRSQLFRTDAMTSAPTFTDNRAQIQNYQSMAAANGSNIMNSSSGQVARANNLSNMGRLFDPINQSNEQMQNSNATISNAWKERTDATMNQNNMTNMAALSKFVGENDMYRANLTKEKGLRTNDILNQVHTTYNNMAQMNALNARYPQFKASGSLWSPQFVPGRYGTDMLSNNGQSSQNPLAESFSQYEAIHKWNSSLSPEEIMNFMKTHISKTTGTYDPKSGMETKSVKSETSR